MEKKKREIARKKLNKQDCQSITNKKFNKKIK